MSRNYICIDWGGSELKGVCLTDQGFSRDFKYQSVNLRVADEQTLLEIALKLKNLADSLPGGTTLWLIGAAGADDAAASQRLKQLLASLDQQAEAIEIYSDYACNHAACLAGRDGILSINGTGSVLYGTADQEKLRTGGWGYLLDETPSGAYFGRRAIEGILRHLDGESGYENFYQACRNRFGEADRRRIIDELYRSSGIQARLGSYAPVLTASYDSGNPHAVKMIDDSVARLAAAIANQFRLLKITTAQACGSGGLWANWPTFSGLVSRACAARHLDICWHRREFELFYGPLILFARTDAGAADLIKTLKSTGA